MAFTEATGLIGLIVGGSSQYIVNVDCGGNETGLADCRHMISSQCGSIATATCRYDGKVTCMDI